MLLYKICVVIYTKDSDTMYTVLEIMVQAQCVNVGSFFFSTDC